MTVLYNCRHDGDQFRITKFDTDLAVESSYLTTLSECECPAGHRPTCRHRQMLPRFIQRNAVNSEWFYDFDRNGWVQFNLQEIGVESAGLSESVQGEGEAQNITATEIDQRMAQAPPLRNAIVEAYVNRIHEILTRKE